MVEISRPLVGALVTEAVSNPIADLPFQIGHQPRELVENRVRPRLQELTCALQARGADLGRVVLAAAVDEIMSFIDDEHGVAEGVPVEESAEADCGVEDVVVVADHQIHLR